MLLDYRVIAPGHHHAGKALAVGDVVLLRVDVAARFPHVFARAAVAPAPGRSSRRAPSAPDDTTSAPSTLED